MIPDDRSYTRTHEWIQRENGQATVGITAPAQEQLGDLTFIELPTIGDPVTAGTECMTIESVKAASDVYAPASGTISEVNTALKDDPGLVNRDPYGDGWLFKLREVQEPDTDAPMDAAAYADLVAHDAH